MRKTILMLLVLPIFLFQGKVHSPVHSRDLDEQEIAEQTFRSSIEKEFDLNERKKELLSKLLKEKKHLFNDSSLRKINKISKKHGIKPSWLILTMFKESRVNPKAVNPSSGASGIIQFMPSTARNLGTTVEKIREMSFYRQLRYVDKYLVSLNKSKLINTYEDFYLAIFYPRALGKDLNYTIGAKNSKVVDLNRSIANERGIITKKDVALHANRI